MRPWNATLLVPLWPAKESVPATAVRLQAAIRRFFSVCATHVPPTLRPPMRWVKLKVTVACSLSENQKVVPVGVFARLTRASRLPSRHLVVDWRTCRTTGGADVSLGTAGDGEVGWTGAVVDVATRASVVNV